MTVCCTCRYTLAQIAEHLGAHYSTVSRRVGNSRRDLANDPTGYCRTLNVTFESLTAAAVDRSLLSACLADLEALCPRPHEVEVIITGDFGRSVREWVPDPAYAEHYSAERVTGMAVAKTIPLGDARIALVVNGRLLDPRLDLADIDTRRLFAHEGRHILMQQFGEETNDAGIRMPTAGPASRDLIAIAGITVSEYRVELALCQAGSWPDAGYVKTIPDVLDDFRRALDDAVTLRYPNEPIDRTYRTVVSTFSQIATQLAYVAAELAARGDESGLGEARSVQSWERLIGPHWNRFATCLSRFPSADERSDRAGLDAGVIELRNALYTWLRYIGFSYDDLEDGSGYFDVLRHDF